MSTHPSSDTLLSARNLTKIFGSGESLKRAVDNVSFDVNKGEIIAIVGESCSGKSTLARMLLRLSQPTLGELWLNGKDVTNLKGSRALRPYWRDVQGIFQNPVASFNQFYSVGRVFKKSLALVENPGSISDQSARMDESLRLVGLNPADVLTKGAHQLSGGQLQRTMIARALMVNPEILIADESTSALDASLRVTVLNVLRDLRQRLGTSVLFITHDIGQANYISDRIFVMYHGEMVEQGKTLDVLQHPRHDYTKRLLADVPRIEGWDESVPLIDDSAIAAH